MAIADDTIPFPLNYLTGVLLKARITCQSDGATKKWPANSPLYIQQQFPFQGQCNSSAGQVTSLSRQQLAVSTQNHPSSWQPAQVKSSSSVACVSSLVVKLSTFNIYYFSEFSGFNRLSVPFEFKSQQQQQSQQRQQQQQRQRR